MDAQSFDIDKLIKICRENDASMVGVFGSVAIGEDTSTSDIDTVWLTVERDIPELKKEIKLNYLTYRVLQPGASQGRVYPTSFWHYTHHLSG